MANAYNAKRKVTPTPAPTPTPNPSSNPNPNPTSNPHPNPNPNPDPDPTPTPHQAGELSTKDYRTSGFKSGKGIALDAESMAKEESKKRTGRKAAMRAAGVDGDADDEVRP